MNNHKSSSTRRGSGCCLQRFVRRLVLMESRLVVWLAGWKTEIQEQSATIEQIQLIQARRRAIAELRRREMQTEMPACKNKHAISPIEEPAASCSQHSNLEKETAQHSVEVPPPPNMLRRVAEWIMDVASKAEKSQPPGSLHQECQPASGCSHFSYALPSPNVQSSGTRHEPTKKEQP